MHKVKVAIVGYGYWGPNLVRNFRSNTFAEVKMICDNNAVRSAAAHKDYPDVETSMGYSSAISDDSIDAIVIATNIESHFKIAKEALTAGKHVFVEKPLTHKYSDAMELVELAERKKLILMCGHTFLYSESVRQIKKYVTSENFGELKYFDSTRINLGLFQDSVNVAWDLAVHDISILFYISADRPRVISATGHSFHKGHPEFVSYISLIYDNFVAHINVNWFSPVKIRQTLLGGSRQMLLYDDLSPSEKIKIYDKGIETDDTFESRKRLKISYRTGDILIPLVGSTEPLSVEVADFIGSINTGLAPLSSARFGADIVKALEYVSKSITANGSPIITDF
jgi:predicted dehydrogenase